ncbi:MAG: hypothetical protein EON60_06995 [Alphaproteobacteria bacterium]|nr:MAG: hypothetical protein EON60_06995 [Alphaproteobacteria bacterium]
MSEKKSNLRAAVSVVMACVSVLAMVGVFVAWYFMYQLLQPAEDPRGLQMTVTGIGPRFMFKEVEPPFFCGFWLGWLDIWVSCF